MYPFKPNIYIYIYIYIFLKNVCFLVKSYDLDAQLYVSSNLLSGQEASGNDHINDAIRTQR
jgi:hypothetical protein